MKLKQMVVATVMLVGSLVAPNARAEKGLYLGTGLGLGMPNQDGDVLDEVDPEPGFAWELIHLGYNFNDNFGVGFQWGAAVGSTDFDNELTWGQDYFTISGRYTFAGRDFEPYVELGAGPYVYTLIHDEYDAVSDPELGARIALGGNFNLGRVYLAPEFSYHMVNYDEADVDDDWYGDYDIDFEERGDMFLFLLKIGYNFGG